MYSYFDQLNLKPDEVIVYLRKSRADDPLLPVSEILSKHETILDEWAEKQLGCKVPESNKYREVVSGETIADRPEIQKILRLVESPKYKALLIVEVQRLSRGDLEDAGRLIKLLRYTNTLVITPHKTYDLQDEYDRDSFERELKRGNEYLEYTKKIMNRGRLLSVSQGNFINSTPPYGYNKVWVTEGKKKCPTLAINEEQAEIVRLAFDFYANQDMGIPSICYYLDSLHVQPPRGGNWSPSHIRDMLTNPVYIGKVRWNWRKTVTVVEDSEILKIRPRQKAGDYLVFDGKHEAIVSSELFEAVQQRFGKNPRYNQLGSLRNPFAGILFCHCGRAMTYRTYKSRNDPPRLICVDHVHCNTGSCTFDELLVIVKDSLRQCVTDYEYLVENKDTEAAEAQEKIIRSLENKLQALDTKELSLWESHANPDPSLRMPTDVFRRLNEKLAKDRADLREALMNARASMPNTADYEETLVRFRDALRAMEDPNADASKKNALLRACIERIDYNREPPQRMKSQKKSVRKDGKRISIDALPRGANWTNPPITVDIKLKV